MIIKIPLFFYIPILACLCFAQTEYSKEELEEFERKYPNRPKNAAPVPKAPEPSKEHHWLQKFIGEWDVEAEVFMGPRSKVPVSKKEIFTDLGGFWVLRETNTRMNGKPVNGQAVLGYNPYDKCFELTSFDSASPQMWHYKGVQNQNTLTLKSSGYFPIKKIMCEYKEVIEFSEDGKKRTFVSSMKEEGSEDWFIYMKGTATKVE